MALLVQVPHTAGNNLTEALYSPHLDMHQRMLILETLASAAQQLADPHLRLRAGHGAQALPAQKGPVSTAAVLEHAPRSQQVYRSIRSCAFFGVLARGEPTVQPGETTELVVAQVAISSTPPLDCAAPAAAYTVHVHNKPRSVCIHRHQFCHVVGWEESAMGCESIAKAAGAAAPAAASAAA